MGDGEFVLLLESLSGSSYRYLGARALQRTPLGAPSFGLAHLF